MDSILKLGCSASSGSWVFKISCPVANSGVGKSSGSEFCVSDIENWMPSSLLFESLIY